MSKCREAFEELYGKQELVRSITNPEFYADFEVTRAWRYWQAAWNAATKNAVKICEGQMTGVNPVGDMAREECAEEIEREQCK